MNRVRGAEHGVDGHISQHPATGSSQRAGHVFQDLARTPAQQGERNHPQRQARRFAAFNIANCEGVAADDHVRGDVVGNGAFAGGAIFCTHRGLPVDKDAFRAFRQILRPGVFLARHLVFFQRRGPGSGRGHARLPHFAAELSGSGKQHARVVGKAARRLRLRGRSIGRRQGPGCACSGDRIGKNVAGTGSDLTRRRRREKRVAQPFSGVADIVGDPRNVRQDTPNNAAQQTAGSDRRHACGCRPGSQQWRRHGSCCPHRRANHRIGGTFRHNAGYISKNAGVNNLVALTGRVVIAHALHIPVVV